MTRATFTALPVVSVSFEGPAELVGRAMRWMSDNGHGVIPGRRTTSYGGPVPGEPGITYWRTEITPDHAEQVIAYLREQGFEGT